MSFQRFFGSLDSFLASLWLLKRCRQSLHFSRPPNHMLERSYRGSYFHWRVKQFWNNWTGLVIFIVKVRSGIDNDLVIQHFDDCCAAAPRNSQILEWFDAEYFWVAEELGIKLAPHYDPELFGPFAQSWSYFMTINYQGK